MALADLTKPVLTSLVLPTTIDVSSGDAAVPITVGATDVGLGIDYVIISLDRSYQSTGGGSSGFALYDSNDSFSDGISSETNVFSRNTASGTYSIHHIALVDKAGNSIFYDESELISLGFQTFFTVKGAPSDLTKPVLTSLVLPTTIDISSGDAAVPITVGATDVGLGIDYVIISLDRSYQSTGGGSSGFALYDSNDSFSDGISSETNVFSRNTASGTYSIHHIALVDKAGNSIFYDESELISLGFQTSFTVTSILRTDGTAADDMLRGTDSNDLIDGKAGRDAMSGLSGDDTYYVDNVGDQIFEAVGGGTDKVLSRIGFTLTADQEIERLETTNEAGIEAIDLTGNAFANTLMGNAGDNILDGKGEADTLKAGLGNDTYVVDIAGDQVFEAVGQGNDTVVSTVSYVLAAGQEIETLQLDASTGSASLILTGNEFANTLFGNAGDNILDGKGEADTLKAGLGNDTYIVDTDGDRVVEANGQGSDTIVSTVSYILAAGQEVETLQLDESIGNGSLNLTGNEFANTLLGNDGDNVLNGKGEADILKGGLGNDTYIVDTDGDRVVEANGQGSDTIVSTVSYILAAGQEVETLQLDESIGNGSLNLTGNEFANTLLGNDGDNVLDGGSAADILTGEFGNDTYVIGTAQDQVFEANGQGNDTVVSTVSYVLTAGQEIEILQVVDPTGNGSLTLTGNEFANTLLGDAGDNVLDGGSESDILTGGLGNDTYAVDTAGDRVLEARGRGTDTIMSTVNYVLAADQEIETLQLAASTGSANLNLTGNDFANILVGNAGDNVLDGKGGIDILKGGLGNDTYIVDTAGDRVLEARGQGTDTVVSIVSYALSADQQIETLQLAKRTGSASLNITGNNFANILLGNAGDNVLDGKGGIDILKGGFGNDSYAVDKAKDQVFEDKGQGSDTIISTVSYALAAGQEIETLQFAKSTGSASLTLTGNEFANTLLGNAGNNVLDGKGGADILRGGLGNDTYMVDSAKDQVFEAKGRGTDTIVSTVSYILAAGQEIETLQFAKSTGSANLNLTGNDFANMLLGNAGNNVLDGKGGIDILKGGLGNDTYVVDKAKDQVVELKGQGTDTVVSTVSYALATGQHVETLQLARSTGSAGLTLAGNEFANTLSANAGANGLDGKGGADILSGRGGADTFVFSTALGSGNVDHLADFSVRDDGIRLMKAIFTGLAPGDLAASAFKDIGAAKVDANDRILYKHATGELFFDADGSGAGKAVLFAVVDTKAALTHHDFFVV